MHCKFDIHVISYYVQLLYVYIVIKQYARSMIPRSFLTNTAYILVLSKIQITNFIVTISGTTYINIDYSETSLDIIRYCTDYIVRYLK